ncbi:MAG: tRNA preQ1(34) S-adenosylmethionine ribosyltransferase-isomerase QueA [Clostridia bacterium]|nr:tRNA preQ1(34) S-adenosylmethionine ribosyltransferase-isomerase QueA [Clostridia bacterium]
MNLFKKSQFNYDLPEELIAQFPVEPRDSSRLLILNRQTQKITHEKFYNLVNYLNPNDCLILNDSRVLPARIWGKNINTEHIVEFLLLKEISKNTWETLVKPGKKAKINYKFNFQDLLFGEIIDILEDGNRIIKFNETENFFANLEKIGTMPLPPYIKQKLKDQSRYQTVYARDLGSAAAPTAGLHFTESLMNKIKEKNIKIGFVTLHVGLGTFRPVKEENINNHKMHSENFVLPQETINIINETKKNNGRVICVGTTTCRVLESVYQKHNKLVAGSDSTDIFIKPGFEFKVIDSMITNFHLPESTLIILISSFAGHELALNSYKIAVENKYRFFSFGDSMMIV